MSSPSRKNRINIYDIANLADVSISTVSRVLNNYPHVAPDKRARVMEVLKTFNYMPNAAARSLSSMRSRKIGIMITDIRHAHYANIAYTIERETNRAGYIVVLCNTGLEEKEHEKYLRVLAQQQVDGIIMVGSVFSNTTVEKCLKECLSDIPVLMHNGKIEGDNIFSIQTADPMGIALALDYLVEKGRKKIVFVQDHDTWVARAKHDVLVSYGEKLGLDIIPERIIKVNSGMDGGCQAGDILLSSGVEFDAVIGCDDLTAIGIIDVLNRHGLRVPDDVSIISYNNSIHAETCRPKLTTVDNKMLTIGKLLAKELIRILDGKEPTPVEKIPTVLVVRDSA